MSSSETGVGGMFQKLSVVLTANNSPMWKILVFTLIIVYCTHMYLSHIDHVHAVHPADILSSSQHEAILVNPQNLPSQGKIHSPIRKIALDSTSTDLIQSGKKPVVSHTGELIVGNTFGEIDGRVFKIVNRTILPAERQDMLKRLANYKLSSHSIPSTVVKEYGNKTLTSLRVVHIPRTATYSLVHTAIHYCCDHLQDVEVDAYKPTMQLWNLDPSCRSCLRQPVSLNGDMWAHYPYISALDAGHAMAILRSPRDRLASQLNYMRSLEGLMTSFGVSNIDAMKISMIFKHRFLGKKDDFLAMLTSADPSQYAPITFTSMAKNLNTNSANSGNTPAVTKPSTVKRENRPNFKTVSSLVDLSPAFLTKVDECYTKIQQLAKPSRDDLEPCRWQLAALYPGIQGCQTKMLIGRSCADSYSPMTEADVVLAKQRIDQDFAFIGKIVID